MGHPEANGLTHHPFRELAHFGGDCLKGTDRDRAELSDSAFNLISYIRAKTRLGVRVDPDNTGLSRIVLKDGESHREAPAHTER